MPLRLRAWARSRPRRHPVSAIMAVAPTAAPTTMGASHPSQASGPSRYRASSGSKPQRPEYARVPGGLACSSRSLNQPQISSEAPARTPKPIAHGPSQECRRPNPAAGKNSAFTALSTR